MLGSVETATESCVHIHFGDGDAISDNGGAIIASALWRLPRTFEKRFMHLVDTDASRALEKIIAGETDNWSARCAAAGRGSYCRCCSAIPRR